MTRFSLPGLLSLGILAGVAATAANPASAQGVSTTAPSDGGTGETQSAPAVRQPLAGNRSGTIVDEQGPGLPPEDAQQTTRGTNNHEVFRVLGLSGQIASPVTPAYNASAGYSTYAGQPGGQGNAILANSTDGAP